MSDEKRAEVVARQAEVAEGRNKLDDVVPRRRRQQRSSAERASTRAFVALLAEEKRWREEQINQQNKDGTDGPNEKGITNADTLGGSQNGRDEASLIRASELDLEFPNKKKRTLPKEHPFG